MDKSLQVCPDRAGHPFKATVEGQVSQLLLCFMRGETPCLPLVVRAAVGLEVTMLHFMTTFHSAHLAPSPNSPSALQIKISVVEVSVE